MVSFHSLGAGNGFYLREGSQQIKQGKGLCITSAYHPSPSKEELPATAAPLSLSPLVPAALFRNLHDTAVPRVPEQHSIQSQRQVKCLAWGTCRWGRIISYFHLLSFSFLKALLFAPHTSASIFPFPRPGFQLCLLQLHFLSPPWSLPFPCPPASSPLGQVEEWWGGGWRLLWRFSSHNMGVLASSQEQLLVLISKVKWNAMGRNRSSREKSPLLLKNHLNTLQKCLEEPMLYPAPLCALWWNLSRLKKCRKSMNASSLAAPEVYVSKPCQDCCASKCKHTSWAHGTHHGPSCLSQFPPCEFGDWAGTTLTWHCCLSPKRAADSWSSCKQ